MAQSSGIYQETLDQITTHLIFPRHLTSGHEHESILMQLVLAAIRSTDEIFPLPLSSKKFLQSFQRTHPLASAITISTELQNLSPGEMLGFYVRKQKSCLVVYHTPKTSLPKEYIVSTFPVTMKKFGINGCDGGIQVKMI